VVHVPAASRDGLRQHLDERDIATAVYYDTPLHHEPALSGVAKTPVPLANAEAAARTGLALPVHPDLRPGDLDRVADAVCGFFSAT
jgi:dTDP-4-amino-4,6-dideoxygalactose transaminase